MVLRQVRRGLVAPRHGVHVEAVTRVARALRRGVDRKLERAHRRRSAQHVGRELIGTRRELHLDARTRAVPGVHAREPRGRGARVIAGAVAEVLRLLVIEAAHDRELLAQRRERCEHGRELEARAFADRLERSVDDAVADVHEAEPRDPRRRVRAEGGQHRVEHRQRDRRAGGAQERAPRQGSLGDERHRSTPSLSCATATVWPVAGACTFRILNGTLSTMPSTIVENA